MSLARCGMKKVNKYIKGKKQKQAVAIAMSMAR